jgi:hypothetical protein
VRCGHNRLVLWLPDRHDGPGLILRVLLDDGQVAWNWLGDKGKLFKRVRASDFDRSFLRTLIDALADPAKWEGGRTPT